MIFKRVTGVVEVIGLVAGVAFVVMLFTNEPSPARPSPDVVVMGATQLTLSSDQARQIYLDSCSSCHGEEGEGIYGPALAGDSSKNRFPDEKEQIAIVANGVGQMRSFSSDLSPEQIRAVVTYVRNLPTKG